MVAVGDRIPDVEVRTMGAEGPVAVQTGEVLGSGKVLLFAVPGAFTPGCSKLHMPGYVQNAAALRDKGISKIVCTAVNDAFVMAAWAEQQGADKDIVMLADGNGAFAEAMGLVLDGSGIGLGKRSQRYAAIVENGVITDLSVEPKPGVDVSSCDAMIAKL